MMKEDLFEREAELTLLRCLSTWNGVARRLGVEREWQLTFEMSLLAKLLVFIARDGLKLKPSFAFRTLRGIWNEEDTAMTARRKVCVICGLDFEEFGHNAEPVKVGRCCDRCNSTLVIPVRLRAARQELEKIKQGGEA